MIYKIFGIFKLPHSFNFCDISATFIVTYCMAFTENLFYSTCDYSYWVLMLQLRMEAAAIGQLHCTRRWKWCLLFPQMSSQASIPHDQPHCTVEAEILTFFWVHLSCAHKLYQSESHQERLNNEIFQCMWFLPLHHWAPKSSDSCMVAVLFLVMLENYLHYIKCWMFSNNSRKEREVSN